MLALYQENLRFRVLLHSWHITGPAALLLCGLCSFGEATAQEEPPPNRPFRLLQETPWSFSTLSGVVPTLLPVSVYWEEKEQAYFLDLVAFFKHLGYQTTAASNVVRARDGRGVYVVDFARGQAWYERPGRGARPEPTELVATEYLIYGDRNFLTLPATQKLFPEGAVDYDAAVLHIRLSSAAFPLDPSPFSHRAISATHARGPLLYGRTRRILGGTHLQYRVSRSQRQHQSATYNGSFQVRASAFGGRVSMDGSASQFEGSTNTRIRSLNYLLDFPDLGVVTRVELGRMRLYEWPFRQSYDGVRLGNTPLSTRHVQREAVIKGVAEPDAIVEASVGGVIADRVQADGLGRYVLRVPAYYGSSEAQLDITPLGGGIPVSTTRYLFIGEDLTPPGTFYWDAHVGRDEFTHASFGFIQARYGLTQGLSVDASVMQVDSSLVNTMGLTKNLWGLLTTSVEASFPESAGRATAQLFFKNIRFQGNAEISRKPGLSFYKERIQGQLGVRFSGLSIFLNGGTASTFNGATTTSINSSGSFRVSRRTNVLLSLGYFDTQVTGISEQSALLRWKSMVTRYVSMGPIRGRVGLQGDGGTHESVDFGGMTLYASFRTVTLGARVGYDFPAENMAASLRLRMDAPWVSINNHSALESDNTNHTQSLYGSMELGRGLRLTRQSKAFSSAILQPYLDVNRDGQRGPDEPLVNGLDIDVVKARVQRMSESAVRADFLVPSTHYQVIVNPHSVQGPDLELPTGYTFSFMSDPGETKQVNIPVIKNTIVDGTVTALPLSSPTLAMIVFYEEEAEVLRAPVSQEGSFTALLPPGVFRLEVADLLGAEDLSAFTQVFEVQPVSRQNIFVEARESGN